VGACTGVISGSNDGNGGSALAGSSGGGNGGADGGTNGTDSPYPSTIGSPPPADGGCASLGTIGRRIWLLSAEQWGAAIKDLAGLQTAPVLTERGNEPTYAFFSAASNEMQGPELFGMYTNVQHAVTGIDGQVGATIAPCTGTSASAQTQCAQTFIQGFAQKAYRRPVDSSEVTNLMAVYSQGAMQSYKTGIELMVEAVMMAPSFDYRTELGGSTPDSNGNYALTPYEIASQLSFTLLGSLPDAELTAAAASGKLSTTADIQAQIQRLFSLPAVQANIANIILGWFNVNQVFAKIHDTTLLPASEQNEMAIETDLQAAALKWVSNLLFNGSGKVDDLLTSQTFYANKRLATLYPELSFNGQPPADDTTFVAATWPASEGRSGMLTQPSWLWAQSDPGQMSIVKRGKAIHDNIVCADSVGPMILLTSPEAMNTLACKSADGTMTLSACNTEEEQSDARMKNSPCNACHAQMDPYSRVLDDFGPIGNYQPQAELLTDAGNSFDGGAVDLTVTFVPSTTGRSYNSPLAPQTLTGAQGMANALVKSGQFRGCSVQQIASYGVGAQITTYDTCELDSVRKNNDGTVLGLFTNVMTAQFMLTRAGGN
jgi:hypothetical protein